jgi:hypothetical protein
MEDSDYRDLMRADLARARRDLGRRSNHSGSIVVSLVLIVAAAAVIMHHLGLIQLPK